MSTKKRPTRRKPDRHNKHGYYSTVQHYSPPWTIWASGFAMAMIPLAIIFVAAYGHLHGWW